MNFREFIGGLISSPADTPSAFQVQPESLIKQKQFATPFKAYEHYFLVEITEMYLTDKTKWFKEYTPVVYTTTAFQYGKDPVETPFIVGPALLQANMKELGGNLLLRNTTIAGWHPYAGGKITLTILLCKAVTTDYIDRTFRAIEKISGVFGPASAATLGKAISMSKVIVEGVNELIDSKGIDGLALFRKDFDSQKADGFYPGYYLLMDKKINEADRSKFFVKNDQLFWKDSAGTEKKYEDSNYVLFSIQQSTDREDYKKFPFFQYYERAQEMAVKKPLSDEKVQEIQDQLSALYIAMLQSPDLTESHANLLMDNLYGKVKKIKDGEYKLAAARGAVLIDDDQSNGGEQIIKEVFQKPYSQERSSKIRAL